MAIVLSYNHPLLMVRGIDLFHDHLVNIKFIINTWELLHYHLHNFIYIDHLYLNILNFLLDFEIEFSESIYIFCSDGDFFSVFSSIHHSVSLLYHQLLRKPPANHWTTFCEFFTEFDSKISLALSYFISSSERLLWLTLRWHGYGQVRFPPIVQNLFAFQTSNHDFNNEVSQNKITILCHVQLWISYLLFFGWNIFDLFHY